MASLTASFDSIDAKVDKLILAARKDGYMAAVKRVQHYADESNGLWDIRKLMDTAHNLMDDMENALE